METIKYTTALFFLIIQLLTITQGTEENTIIISENGTDLNNCGRTIPCRTIGYVLTHRAVNNCIIKVASRKFSKPFIVRRSFRMLKNITLLGINGRPIISSQNSLRPTHLFEEGDIKRVNLITLRIEDLIFKGIGILRLINNSPDYNISFQNCYFQNVLTSRDSILIQGDKLNSGLVYFHQCYFTNNVALQASTIISVIQSRSAFYKCHFSNNLSSGNGTVFVVGGDSTFKNNCFYNNTQIAEHLVNTMGGCIHTTANSVVHILNCSFEKNMGTHFGGAVSAHGDKLQIKSSLFEYNTVVSNNTTKAHGGAVHIGHNCDVDIFNCTFLGNKATAAGGAIFTHGKTLIMKASSFKDNVVASRCHGKSYGGAVFIYHNDAVKISYCYFRGNKATNAGGAIFSIGKQVVIQSSLFERNIVRSSCTFKTAGGGVFAYRDSVVKVLNCSFISNHATQAGGAIFTKGKKLLIKSSKFEYNSALINSCFPGIEGGAVFLHTGSVAEIFNSSFIGNKATFVGGAICTRGKRLLIKSSSFEYNSLGSRCSANGGAIFSELISTIELLDCLFSRNNATQAGGAIFTKGKKLLIKSSKFEYNSALINGCFPGIEGGAVFLHTGSVAEIFNSSFIGNKATFVGGAICTRGKRLLIKSSSFEYNSLGSRCSANGGAIFSELISTVELLDCLFSRNNATQAGGAIYVDGRKLFMRSSIFKYNAAVNKYNAVTSGGAVFVNFNSVAEILNCSFEQNEATYYGGAISTCGKMLLIRSSLFTYNAVGNQYIANALGGSVCIYTRSVVVILNSLFQNNAATHKGGAIYSQGKKLIVKSSSFKNNTVCNNYVSCGGAISGYDKIQQIQVPPLKNSTAGDVTDSISTFYIFNCSFQRNMAKENGGAIHSKGVKLTIKSSSFSDNSAGQSGGAIFIVPVSSLSLNCSILKCSFSQNKATLIGGAVSYTGKELFLKTSTFKSNTAVGMYGEGGGLFMNSPNQNDHSKAIIFQCIFDGNFASYRGGAIMATAITLNIKNSTFQSFSYPHFEGYSGGDLLYSKTAVTLEHVSFLDFDDYNVDSSIIVHQYSRMDYHKMWLISPSKILNFNDGVHIKCLTGKNIEMSNHTITPPNKFTFIIISCSFCAKNSYSLEASHIDVISSNQSIEKTNVKCHNCPFGGRCEKGKIRASDNFWGYVYGKEVRFVSCPFGYCCSKSECASYFSCHSGRSGTLCGQCERGLTENLISSDCLSYEECQHPLYFLVIISCGIIYIIIIMYLDKVVRRLTVLLIPRIIRENCENKFKKPIRVYDICNLISQFAKLKFSGLFKENVQTVYLTADVLIQEEDNEDDLEIIQCNIEMVDDEELQSIVVSQKQNEDSVFPGLLKIVLFFYQTNLLFRIYIGSRSKGFLHKLQEAISTLFNLRTDGIFSQELSWCPFINLKPVTKLFLKSSFIVYLFFLIFVALVLHRIGRILKILNTESRNSRLLSCTLRLILISYAGITATCFSLLSCVDLGHHGNVLFIDGSISCFRWWQIIVLCIVCCWIIPFPVSIYTSSQLLQNSMLSARHFLLCLLLPLPGICYWLYICRINRSKKLKQLKNRRKELKQDVKELLEIIQGPFRMSTGCDAERQRRLCWESILIARRLVLIFVKTFFIDTFFCLSLMLLCTNMFLIHHIYIKPFSSNLLNNIETVSLSMLNIVCFLNLLPAFIYAYPTCSYDHIQSVIQILKVIETVLNLFFPILLGLAVAIFVCIRILQIMIWLCQCFGTLIRCCTKYKLS